MRDFTWLFHDSDMPTFQSEKEGWVRWTKYSRLRRPSLRCQTHWGRRGMVTGYLPCQLTIGSQGERRKLTQMGSGSRALADHMFWHILSLKESIWWQQMSYFWWFYHTKIALKSEISLIPRGMVGIWPESGRTPPKVGRLTCLHDFPGISMTFAVFHDYPGLEYGFPKFHDFPWLSRPSGHPVINNDRHNMLQQRTLTQMNIWAALEKCDSWPTTFIFMDDKMLQSL